MDEINKNLATLQLTGDAENFQETQSFTAQEPDQDQTHSHQNYMALTRKDQEIKLTIERLQHQIHQIQEQLHQEISTSQRLRHQRDQYRSTAKDLANQVIRLQHHHHVEDFYDSDKEDLQIPKKKKKNTPVSQPSYAQNAEITPVSQTPYV